MALSFNGTDQWIDAPWTPSAVQPMTLMAWVRRTGTLSGAHTVVCVGDINQDIAFNNLVVINNTSYAISFVNFAEVLGGAVSNTTDYFHLAAVFNGTNIIIYINGAATSVAWTPSGTNPFDTFAVGSTISSDAGIASGERFAGFIEHVAVWQSALTATQIGNLANESVNPLAMDADNLRIYLPLVNDLALDYGSLSLTAHGLASPSYETSGISYPSAATECTCVGFTSGTPSVPAIDADISVPVNTQDIATGAPSVPAIVLGSQTQVIPADIATGAPVVPGISIGITVAVTTQDISTGAPVVPAIPVNRIAGRIINHTNFDASTWSDAEILAAAALKVYFEHASTGEDIVGDSDTDSSTGLNHDGSTACGMAQLHTANNRYLCDRESFDGSNDPTWFATHNGLQANMRGNPTPATKVAGFYGMSAGMRAAIKVAMMKFCWIDVWDGSGFNDPTPGYVADGAAFAAAMIEDAEAFEAANPGIIHVWWTMPLQTNSDIAYPQRQIFNDAIRTYCENNSKYLIDIAAIESHDPDGTAVTDVNGREQAYAPYIETDGGHLASAGRLRMANAYWSMMAQIASEIAVVDANCVGFDTGAPSVPATSMGITVSAATQGITTGSAVVPGTPITLSLNVPVQGIISGNPAVSPLTLTLTSIEATQGFSAGAPSIPEIAVQCSAIGDCVCVGFDTGSPVLDDVDIEVTSNLSLDGITTGIPSVPDITVQSYIGVQCVCVGIDTGAPDLDPIDLTITCNLTLAGITTGVPTVGAMVYEEIPPMYVRLTFRIAESTTIRERGASSTTVVGG